MDKIFKSIDFDGNQLITISEFITAAMDRKKFLSEERLAITFAMFDNDDSGEIELFELIKLFYKSGVSKETWEYMFNEIDTNGDGVVSFEEFSVAMMKMCTHS